MLRSQIDGLISHFKYRNCLLVLEGWQVDQVPGGWAGQIPGPGVRPQCPAKPRGSPRRSCPWSTVQRLEGRDDNSCHGDTERGVPQQQQPKQHDIQQRQAPGRLHGRRQECRWDFASKPANRAYLENLCVFLQSTATHTSPIIRCKRSSSCKRNIRVLSTSIDWPISDDQCQPSADQGGWQNIEKYRKILLWSNLESEEKSLLLFCYVILSPTKMHFSE